MPQKRKSIFVLLYLVLKSHGTFEQKPRGKLLNETKKILSYEK